MTMYKFVMTRVEFLQCLVRNPSTSKGTESHSKSSAAAADSIIGQLIKGTPLAPHEAAELIKCLSATDVFNDADRDRLVHGIEGRVDLHADDSPPTTESTRMHEQGHSPQHPDKQSIENIDNYIPATIWDLLDRGADQQIVYAKVSKLLIDLGIIHPKEILFAHISVILGQCYRGTMPPQMTLIQLVKAEYKAQRSYRPSQVVGPQVYPSQPYTLLTTHADLYNLAYNDSEPCPIPDWVDLEVLKQSLSQAVCRITNSKYLVPSGQQVQRLTRGISHQRLQVRDLPKALRDCEHPLQRSLTQSLTESPLDQGQYARPLPMPVTQNAAPTPLALQHSESASMPTSATTTAGDHGVTQTAGTPPPSDPAVKNEPSSFLPSLGSLDQRRSKPTPPPTTATTPAKSRKAATYSPPKLSPPIRKTAMKATTGGKSKVKHTAAPSSKVSSASKSSSTRLPEFPGMKKKFEPLYYKSVTIYHYTRGSSSGYRVKPEPASRKTRKFPVPAGVTRLNSHT